MTGEELVRGDRSALLFVGRGGMGKSHAVDAVAAAATAADLPVRWVRGRRLERDEPYAAIEDLLEPELVDRLVDSPTRSDLRAARRQIADPISPGLLIVDSSHWVDSASCEVLVGLAASLSGDGLRMLVALRPRSGDPALAALTESLNQLSRPVLFEHQDEQSTIATLAATLHEPLDDDALVELAHETGGSPALIEAVAEASADRAGFEGWRAGGQCPSSLLEVVRARLAVLDDAQRQVLLAMSFGASATNELIAVLGLEDEVALGQAVMGLDDEGLLTADGSDVIALVAEAATQLQPPIERRRHHRQFADVLRARGGSAVQQADHLLAADAAPIEISAVCLLAADELMVDSPSLSLEWIERGVEAGLAPIDVAARRVEAHLRHGSAVDAIRAAEPLFRSSAPGRLDALRQAAVAFVQTRRPKQAASILRQVQPRLEDGDEASLAELGAAICELAAGSCDPSTAGLTAAGTASNPALEVSRQSLQAMRAIVEATGIEELERAVVVASSASDLELSALAEQRQPFAADALAVAAAVYCADLELAERLARAARAAPAATDAQRRSRALRAALVEVWTGAISDDRDPLAEWEELAPADRLVAVAVAAGRARRANDVARQRALVDVSHEVLLQAPDLGSLATYGEVMIAAAKVGLSDRVIDSRTARDRLVDELGGPAALAIHSAWVDVQCAAVDEASTDVNALRTIADGLPDPGGRPSVLREVVQTWCALLRNEASGEQIERAGQQLEQLGYRWEATRLVGSAAMHLDDEAEAKRLLVTARELRAGLAQAGGESAPLTARLSARELEVAELMVGGNTYKEIGARLYISPKTVEHHAARIRQRLDVSSRAELLEVLRAGLGEETP